MGDSSQKGVRIWYNAKHESSTIGATAIVRRQTTLGGKRRAAKRQNRSNEPRRNVIRPEERSIFRSPAIPHRSCAAVSTLKQLCSFARQCDGRDSIGLPAESAREMLSGKK